MSQASSTDGAENEQPASEQGTLGLPEDSEEKENGGHSVMKLSSGISDTGPPQPPEPHVQESVAPDSDLVSEAGKYQPTLSELADTMKRVLEVLQNSTIVPKAESGKDNRSHFWELYGQVAEEHDSEFLKRYHNDMGDILLISGLFSATITSFIIAMESNLIPDPSDTTNALLTQLVYIELGNLTAAGSMPADPASTWSPAVPAVRIQMVA
ncbi:hypothetical protein F4604DRAFT_1933807 [Suillus subluteus]|nr:hypothetical protein F4604DRAFT_1933807 [Suillus subluteus]